jgi:hypothetical protein
VSYTVSTPPGNTDPGTRVAPGPERPEEDAAAGSGAAGEARDPEGSEATNRPNEVGPASSPPAP